MGVDRIVCPKCKYVMVNPLRRHCPNCNYDYDFDKKKLMTEKIGAQFRKKMRPEFGKEPLKEFLKKNYHQNILKPLVKNINNYITLKLENGRTNIYINQKLFRQCKRLVLNFPKEDIPRFEDIESIDEAAVIYDTYLHLGKIVTEPRATPIPNQSHDITPEQEFWGHCSNIQTWVENDYDTRILMSNLSFPLLRELAKVGDPKARKVYKEEIALRLESGYPSVVQYLLAQGYISAFTPTEFQTILGSNDLIKKLSTEPKIIVQFLISCVSKFPTLIEVILLETLKLPEGKNFLISVIQFKPKVAAFKPWITYVPRYLFNLKKVLAKLLSQVDGESNSELSNYIQVINQEIQNLRSQGYILKPPKEKGRLDKTYKMVLVGKSSKKWRLFTKIATQNEENNLQFNLFKVPIYLENRNAKVNLLVWFFPTHQYSNFSMLRVFLRGADAALLIFDINELSTFLYVADCVNYMTKGKFAYRYSLESARYQLSTISKVLVGIKESLVVDSERIKTTPLAERLSIDNDLPYFETSLNNREEIFRIFYRIAELVTKGTILTPFEWSLNTKGEVHGVQVGALRESLAGRSVCYLDQEIVKKMGADTGSIIEIKGKKLTTGITLSDVQERGKGLIRLDGLQRYNAGVTVGEHITIRLVEEVPAEEIEIISSIRNIDHNELSDLIFTKLIYKSVVTGDLIEIMLSNIHKFNQNRPKFEDLNWMTHRKPSLRLIVKNTIPENRVVKITRDTRVKINAITLK